LGDSSGVALFDGVGTVSGTSDSVSLGGIASSNPFSQPYSVTNGTGTPGRGTITESGVVGLIFHIISPTKVVWMDDMNNGTANANPAITIGEN